MTKFSIIRLNYQLYLDIMVDGDRQEAIESAKKLGDQFIKDISSHTCFSSAHFYKVCEDDCQEFDEAETLSKIVKLQAEQARLQIMLDHAKRSK